MLCSAHFPGRGLKLLLAVIQLVGVLSQSTTKDYIRAVSISQDTAPLMVVNHLSYVVYPITFANVNSMKYMMII